MMTARDHNKLLAIFYFVMGGLQMLLGLFVTVVYGLFGGFMLTAGRGDDQIAGGIVLAVAIVVGLFIILLASFTIFTGYSVLKERPIGRLLGIIVSCFVVLSVPLGTALGVYGLWFFFGDVGKSFYAGLKAGSSSPTPPPAPGTWQ
jgi:hypothetical protein